MPEAETRVNPNIVLACGLRDLAAFLDAHPELPEVRATAWVSEPLPDTEARERLTTVARALGDMAVERQRGDQVRIGAEFNGISLHADAAVSALRDAVPEPEYEPIIPKADTPEWGVRRENGQ